MSLWGGIEVGGTTFVCAVAGDDGELLDETTFPTTVPDQTIEKAIKFLQGQGDLAAIGISCFGPVDLDPDSPTYGTITTTPKPDWANTDIVGRIRQALDVPVGFDTDVNGAALGEHRWGAAQGLDTFVYLTIGTGIGGGGMINGQLMHGLVHPEMGHMRLPHDFDRDPFAGGCPFHGDCLEGLANGPAIKDRWEQRPETLPPAHPAWALEAHYIALGIVNLVCILSPQRVILGGGVMQQAQLFPMIRSEVQQLLNGYVKAEAILERVDAYIVPPALGDHAGVKGAIALAQATRPTTSQLHRTPQPWHVGGGEPTIL
jgi:fructokinase